MTTEAPEREDTAAPAADLEEESVLDLTTEVIPAKKIRIDSEDYALLSFDHLSPEDEASVTALFARFQKIFRLLEESKNDANAVREASKLRRYREKLIAKMTTVPRDVIAALGGAKQGQILSAIQEEIGSEVDSEDDGDTDDDDEE